jgi:hypothetical protein
MNSSKSRVVFVVGNGVQQENAIEVAKHLTGVAVSYLNLWTGLSASEPATFDGHSPAVSLSRVSSIVFGSHISSGDITVVPQDVGLLQRLLVKKAKRAGSLVALMPDGVAAQGANTNGSTARLVARTIVDRLMNLAGLVEGQAGSMGSSNPHVVLSWGPGWDSAFAVQGSTGFRYVGCPRMDKYSTVPPGPEGVSLLICSQPLAIPSWSRPYAKQWYEFLESMLDCSSEAFQVRVRLHPAEHEDSAVPSSLKSAHLVQPLRADLEWASVVASPFSTVLVEALAADRPFFALSPDEYFDGQAQRTPFFADDRMRISRWSVDHVRELLPELINADTLKTDYLHHVGRSARLTAELFESMASGRPSVP